MSLIGYAGSYAAGGEQLIRFVYDEIKEQFIKREELNDWPDAKYLSLENGCLAGVVGKQRSGVRLLDVQTNTIEEVLNEDVTSCCIAQDDAFVYTANYHEGTLSIYQKHPLRLYKRILIQPKAGCHQVLRYQSYLLVPCLLLDEMRIYDVHQDFALIRTIPFPKGSGPRHGVFSQDGQLYVVSELSNQLFCFQVGEQMEVSLINDVDLKETPGQKAAAAAIRMDHEERYLYLSLREANQIVVYDRKLKRVIQRCSSGGDHPRDMILSPDETYLFVIHRMSNTIRVFKRDTVSGRLEETTASLSVMQGVCIVFDKEETL